MLNTANIKILSFHLLLLFTLAGHAQFAVLNSGVDKDLLSVHFPDHETGYAGGADGVVIKTTNGGKRWFMQNEGITQTVNDLYFINRDLGFIVGENNTFSKTDDGGVHWTTVDGLFDADYTAIHFVDTVNGFAVGHSMEGGVFCKTTDGGNTWTSKMIDQDCSGSGLTPGIDCDDIYLTRIAFLDDKNGLISGFTYNFTYGKHPFICITNDGGQTFQDISPIEQKTDWYNGKEVVSINYMNDHDACAIMNTGSGTDFMFISDYRIKSFEQNQYPTNFSSRGRFFTSHFLGRFIGYFAGIIDGESQIIKTIDQGNSFMFMNPPTNNTLYASCFVDHNNGYFVGEKGTILHLSDKANIVYNAAGQKGEYDYDPPFSVASLKRKNKLLQVQIYNLKRNNPKNFSISVFDSHGRQLTIKPRRVKIYSDEIRIKVRVGELESATYFYTVKYSDRSVINGKLNLSSYAHITQ